MEGYTAPESNSGNQNNQEEKEPGLAESWIGMMKVVATLDHFLKKKGDEIKDIIHEAKERDAGPLALAESFTNTTAKLSSVIMDYSLEVERRKHDLREDSINEVSEINKKAKELEGLRSSEEERSSFLSRLIDELEARSKKKKNE